MNSFSKDEIYISKIHACVYVAPNTGRHIHNDRPYHGLVLKLSGESRYLFSDGSELSVKGGDVFYLPKFSSYRVINVVSGDCIAINYDITDSEKTYGHFCLRTDVKSKIISDFKSVLEEFGVKKQGYTNRSLLHLYSIISHIQGSVLSTYLPSGTKAYALRASELIAEGLHDPNLTVDGISKALGITPEYLRKIFGSVYGVSPKTHIINSRMEKSKELLLTGEFSISDIAHLCGYESESYFSSEFKRAIGISPSEYVQTK